MSDSPLKRITEEFPDNITEIKTQITNILDLFEQHLTNHKLSYFYKKNTQQKQEKRDYIFSQSDIMHLVGIKAYKIISSPEIKTVSKEKITVTNASRFYSDYLSEKIDWDNVWIDSSDYLTQKLMALPLLPKLKEYGVQLGEYLSLKNFEIDSFLKNKDTLAIGFYSSNEDSYPLLTYHPRTSLNLNNRPTPLLAYKVTKIIDYKINSSGIYEKVQTYNFASDIQHENSTKKKKRIYKRKHK
ncbi:hypothetical protein EFL57_09455 [Weissella confusa]|uniref:PBECR4 domain-containing protein n=1 Tax=Weissella confusa TaxID=1583 RepID=UPI00223A82B0|nr:PBECR4 domain-containing protein [Weissella confusa]MCT0010655.1 hypothetical protein [Weissella confusa]